jgi:hypothetical protein
MAAAAAAAAAAGNSEGVQQHEVGGCSDPLNCCTCLAAKVRSVVEELAPRQFQWAPWDPWEQVFFPASCEDYLYHQFRYGFIT